MSDSLVAFIPARAGSKGIPGKNWKEIAGKPLIHWSVSAAVCCPEISSVCVSTDSEEVKKYVSKEFPKVWFCDRKPEDATDNAPLEPMIVDFATRYELDYLVLIQPTNPLLTHRDLSKGFKLLKDRGFASILSVVKQKRFIWDKVNGVAFSKNYLPLFRLRRQDLYDYYVENGAFYINSKNSILWDKCRISRTNVGLYEMPQDSYFEIDEPEDWGIVESLLLNRLKK